MSSLLTNDVLGLSQKDLAELLDVTQPAISKMERQEDMQARW